MTTIAETLKDREAKYGDFREVSKRTHGVMSVLRIDPEAHKFRHEQYQAIYMIAMKLARIYCGDQDHRDSWHDIAGFSTLIAESLEEK